MGGELIPKPEPHNWTSGAGVLFDASQLLGDRNNGADGFDWTFDGVSAGLDVLITTADPLGAAVAAGVGWLLENVPGISDVWNMLAGNPEAIQQAALTWSNIATRMNEQGQQFATQASSIQSWQGDAASSFLATANDFSKIVGGVASDAQFLSIMITGTGAIVAALREVVYWAISSWLTEDVIPEAIASLATSWCTFGASVAAFLAWLIISTSLTCGVLAEKIGAAGVKVAEVYAKIGELLTKLSAGENALKFGIQALEGAGRAVDNPLVWSVRGAGRQVDNQNRAQAGGG
ncbi:MAG: WXG100 family type VII secretion target [Jatrophihabitantaceae bacterium]